MMTPKTQTIIASAAISLTAGIALVIIPMKPDGSAVVLGMMAVFVLVWNSSKHIAKRKCPNIDWLNSKVRHEILFAIILASLLLLGSISATLAKELELFDGDLVKRIVGVNIGLMLVILGNYMPKKITQLSASCSSSCTCNTARTTSVQRITGWIFVLGGLLYAMAWITFDLDQAGIAIMFAFPVAIAITVIARMIYLKATSPSSPTESV